MTLMTEIHAILAIGQAVLAPLLLSLVPDAPPRLARAARLVHPVAAAAAIAAMFLPTGPAAAALAAPWLGFTGLLGLVGLGRLLRRRRVLPIEETCIDAGLLYVSAGAGWFILSRLGASPMEFGEPIVLLTAVHFHYAGFAAPILAGLAGRALAARDPRGYRVFRPAGAGIVAGMPLVAAGITASPLLEIAAVAVFATSLAALGALLVLRVAPLAAAAAPRALLRLAGLSILFGMGFAAAYGIGEWLRETVVAVPTMVRIHGWNNAIGFALGGAYSFRAMSRGGGL